MSMLFFWIVTLVGRHRRFGGRRRLRININIFFTKVHGTVLLRYQLSLIYKLKNYSSKMYCVLVTGFVCVRMYLLCTTRQIQVVFITGNILNLKYQETDNVLPKYSNVFCLRPEDADNTFLRNVGTNCKITIDMAVYFVSSIYILQFELLMSVQICKTKIPQAIFVFIETRERATERERDARCFGS